MIFTAKKGAAKTAVPKKASEGGPKKTRAPRKTQKQKNEDAAAAAADVKGDEHEDMKDEDMAEDNEDGKSLTPTAPGATPEPFSDIRYHPGTDPTELAYAEARKNYVAPVIDDEHEARIREMPLEAWLRWKEQSGYIFDLLNV